jgi:glycogen operon protein
MDGYLVGRMPPPWVEWNDQYRDEIRDFWRNHAPGPRTVATRLAGSSDLYADDGRSAYNSINFVTAHDGFTLRDVVTYERKHNEANGEDNRDGENDNRSANHGVEGPTDDPAIREVRLRQRKNLMATLLLAQGVPMLLGGDEFGRTQGGNNNAYCQDNEISWFDWTRKDTEDGFYRFCRELIAFRLRHAVFGRRTFYRGTGPHGDQPPDVLWFDPAGGVPDWHGEAGALAVFLDGRRAQTGAAVDDADLYLMFNPTDEDVIFVIPILPAGEQWRLAIDTARPAPEDIQRPGREVPLDRGWVRATARSVVVLLGK